MRLAQATSPKEASFDLTPMIDVVLLLIIFFMLSAQFAQTQTKPMDLPKEEGYGKADWSASTLVIDLDASGQVSVLGRVIGMNDVPGLIGPGAKPGERPALTIRADRNCAAAHLNRLAATLAAAGVRDWRLATVPQGRPPAGREDAR